VVSTATSVLFADDFTDHLSCGFADDACGGPASHAARPRLDGSLPEDPLYGAKHKIRLRPNEKARRSAGRNRKYYLPKTIIAHKRRPVGRQFIFEHSRLRMPPTIFV
jgi:hypothetical protein